MGGVEVKTLHTVHWRSKQGTHYNRIIEGDGHKLEVRIYVDFYPQQNYATVHRWNGQEWKQVHAVRTCSMAVTARSGSARSLMSSSRLHGQWFCLLLERR